MCIEQFGLKVPFPELFFSQLDLNCLNSSGTGKRRRTHFTWHIFTIGPAHNRVFVEDIVNQLRRNANPDFAPFNSFWSWVDKLARFALFLALSRVSGKDQVLKQILAGRTHEEPYSQNVTSRPSQNSASVSCPDMTKSRCKAPNSGLLMRTFFRSRKSVVGSLAVKTGVGRLEPPETEGALDSDSRSGGAVGFGVATAGVEAEETGRLLDTEREGCTGWGKPSCVLLFRLIMLVSSCLNFSRSAAASGRGDVKVKLCPLSSATRPIFSLTCAAPSLLQKSAVR